MGAEEGAEGLRDGAGHQEVRPRQRLVEVVCKPLLGFLLLPLGAVAVATGMVHTVLPPTGVALREAVPLRPAVALLDGAEDLVVGEGQLGVALDVFWSKGGADVTEGGHDNRPCMRVLRRS